MVADDAKAHQTGNGPASEVPGQAEQSWGQGDAPDGSTCGTMCAFLLHEHCLFIHSFLH